MARLPPINCCRSAIEGIEARGYRGDHVGYIHVNDIPPPRTLQRLKRSIALLEGFTEADIKEVFLCFNFDETLTPTTRLNLAPGAPGTEPKAPIEVVVADRAKRLPPPASTITKRSDMTRNEILTASIPPWMMWWILETDPHGSSLGRPILDPDNSELIMASPEVIEFGPPPGWKVTSLHGRIFYNSATSNRGRWIDRSDIVYVYQLYAGERE
ncbi:hypothetical protein DL93DRAFT_1707197 [Clavulina sp. PMI_390]|nr:hypothetical protein DL93DRAFT_1707197 [Clavulina sp. PMI_390]